MSERRGGGYVLAGNECLRGTEREAFFEILVAQSVEERGRGLIELYQTKMTIMMT